MRQAEKDRGQRPAKDLTDSIRRNVTTDWTQRETVRAKLRVMVKRLLKKHAYPPDKQEHATNTVMEQAERHCETWAEEGNIGTVSTPNTPAVSQTTPFKSEPLPLPMAAEGPPVGGTAPSKRGSKRKR